MPLQNASGQVTINRHMTRLVDSLLSQLLEFSSCSYGCFLSLDPETSGFGFVSIPDIYPQIDWYRLASHIWRVQNSKPEYLVIGREEIDRGPRIGPLVEHFESHHFDIVIAIPLLFDEKLISSICIFGFVPPANPSAAKTILRPQMENLCEIASAALASIIETKKKSSQNLPHESAFKGFPAGVLITDNKGVILEANDTFQSLININDDSIIGQELFKLHILNPDFEYLVARLLESNQPFEIVTSIGVSNADDDILGEANKEPTKFIRVRGSAIPSDDNSNSGMVLLAEDVTGDVLSRREASRRARKYSQEIELAKRLQEDFFPSNLQRKRIRITTRLIPAAELAGDFFDIFNLGPNIIGLVMGDVVGKGIPGSLMAMSVHGMIANQAGPLTPPMKVLERVSDALHHQVKGDYWYATCFYAKIHVALLKVTFSRAGFEPPLWWHHDSNEITFLEGEGLPLGILAGNQYTTHQITLAEGDKLLLYTDGLTDSVNPAGERFGHERLIELFKKYSNLSSKNLINLIANTVYDFQGGRELLDDIALALITVVPDSWTTLTIPPYSFQEILESLMNELSMKGVDEDCKFKIRLSLDECVTNAYRHGHKCDERKPITVSYLVESNRVIMKVGDCGQGFDFGLIPDPTLEENLMSTGGRGVFLTLRMMDEVTFNDVGNEITLIKYLHSDKT